MQENNKQLKWSIVTFILAALSVLAMFSQSRSLTVSGLLESLGESGPLAILAALICMAGYIVCEGIALWLMLRHNGYKKRPLDGIMYAAADIYCSAITPSATGGQPVCAWFMSRDGVPMGIITAILMIHLIMHSFASVTICTMKQAVGILQPYIEAEKTQGAAHAGKVLLATVKGDVHDIGKNIVGVVMACNNYEIIDMGVMVPAEQIVRKAVEEHVDIIGLSGLITPSLEEMVNVARELQKAGLNIPIMIGGATTSELHVALKIAPVYSGPVVWMKDASQNALVAVRLMNESVQMEHDLAEKYQHLREDYQHQQEELLSLEEARKHKKKLF